MLKPNCRNDTIRFLKSNVRRAHGSPWRDRVELVGLGFEWQNAALVHGFEGTLGYNPFRLGDVSDATGARDYIAGPDQKSFSPLFPSYASTMANLLGLRFIAIERSHRAGRPSPPAGRPQAGRPYRRRLHLRESARVAARPLCHATGSGPTSTRSRTRAIGRASIQRGRSFWRTAPAADDEALVKLAHNPVRSPGVRIRHYENTKVVIEVDAAQSGFVVLHDVWHPWWRADVDGDDAPILRANVLFRAVQVPAGHHIVTFEFRPVSSAIAEVRDRLTGRAD